MQEEFEREESVSVQTENQTSVETKVQETPDFLPHIEDLRKSEQDVKINTEIQGVTQVEQRTQAKDRVFARKSDEKKVYFKKRLKIVTAVYTAVVALLLGFVIANVVTLAQLNKDITTNTKTIKSQSQQIEKVLEETTSGEQLGNFQISLNEPRDYSDDKKELTWLDKITILFRNLFG